MTSSRNVGLDFLTAAGIDRLLEAAKNAPTSSATRHLTTNM